MGLQILFILFCCCICCFMFYLENGGVVEAIGLVQLLLSFSNMIYGHEDSIAVSTGVIVARAVFSVSSRAPARCHHGANLVLYQPASGFKAKADRPC
ncbi:hypothetical protein Ancab_003938 [Ancistrocladus abbreviatus]